MNKLNNIKVHTKKGKKEIINYYLTILLPSLIKKEKDKIDIKIFEKGREIDLTLKYLEKVLRRTNIDLKVYIYSNDFTKSKKVIFYDNKIVKYNLDENNMSMFNSEITYEELLNDLIEFEKDDENEIVYFEDLPKKEKKKKGKLIFEKIDKLS